MGKTDPAFKTRNRSGLVCKIDNITVILLTLVFIVPGHFTLRFYKRNYVYSSIEEEMELTAVCGKEVEAATQLNMSTQHRELTRTEQ